MLTLWLPTLQIRKVQLDWLEEFDFCLHLHISETLMGNHQDPAGSLLSTFNWMFVCFVNFKTMEHVTCKLDPEQFTTE